MRLGELAEAEPVCADALDQLGGGGDDRSLRQAGAGSGTPSVREAIQASEEKNTVLAKRYGVDRKTIAKWKARKFSSDVRMGPKNPRSKFPHSRRRSDHSRLSLAHPPLAR